MPIPIAGLIAFAIEYGPDIAKAIAAIGGSGIAAWQYWKAKDYKSALHSAIAGVEILAQTPGFEEAAKKLKGDITQIDKATKAPDARRALATEVQTIVADLRKTRVFDSGADAATRRADAVSVVAAASKSRVSKLAEKSGLFILILLPLPFLGGCAKRHVEPLRIVGEEVVVDEHGTRWVVVSWPIGTSEDLTDFYTAKAPSGRMTTSAPITGDTDASD